MPLEYFVLRLQGSRGVNDSVQTVQNLEHPLKAPLQLWAAPQIDGADQTDIFADTGG